MTPDTWTEEKNKRRCELIDKDVGGTISVAEDEELDRLQKEITPPPVSLVQRLRDSIRDSW